MLTTLVVQVNDKPGVLNRVASLFRRRGFNIESLAVGRTEKPGISRMTIVVDTDEGGATRLVANLYKLVEVLEVDNVTSAPSVSRDLAIIKVAAAPKSRVELTELARASGVRVLADGGGYLILEVTETEENLDSLVERLRPFGILEMARTGRLAMRCGGVAGASKVEMPGIGSP
jgi:acetolactate synthase-1/3 small subunit